MKKFALLYLAGAFLISNLKAQNIPHWWTEYSVLSDVQAKDGSPSTLGQLKHFLSKTVDYFNNSLDEKAGDELDQVLMEDWFLDNSNNNNVVTLGEFKRVAKLFYDRLLASHPPQFAGNGTDIAWDTRWLVDTSPFYSDADLGREESLPSLPLFGDSTVTSGYPDEGHYPWSIGDDDDDDESLLLNGQLKFAFSFELPNSLDQTPDQVISPDGSTNKEYRLYSPPNAGERALPLYVFLSGDGGYSGSPFFCRYGQYRAHLLNFRNANNANYDSMVSIIEKMAARRDVDEKRVYIIGYSRGGVALMDILNRRPDLVTVAWFFDPGISGLGLSDNPFRDRDWSLDTVTIEQSDFANRLKLNEVSVYLTPAQNTGNGSIWTRAELKRFYNLFTESGVECSYGILPRNHGISLSRGYNDLRYWKEMSKVSKTR